MTERAGGPQSLVVACIHTTPREAAWPGPGPIVNIRSGQDLLNVGRGSVNVKADEKALLIGVASIELDEQGKRKELPWDVAPRLGIHPKRAQYLYQKWTDKGWFNYGVSARTGWLEPEGLAEAKRLAGVDKFPSEMPLARQKSSTIQACCEAIGQAASEIPIPLLVTVDGRPLPDDHPFLRVVAKAWVNGLEESFLYGTADGSRPTSPTVSSTTPITGTKPSPNRRSRGPRSAQRMAM